MRYLLVIVVMLATPGRAEVWQAAPAPPAGAPADTRTVVAYELVLVRDDARLGPGLVRSEVDCEQEPARLASGGPVCMMLANRAFVNGGAQTMAQFAALLEKYLQARVTDRTGLTGVFDISLAWSAGGDGPIESATADDVGALLKAMPDQLGLELRPAPAAVPGVLAPLPPAGKR